jgi:FkbM family methyltransferase
VSLPASLRRPLARWRRTACEAVGIARYSRPALHALDRKLERYLDFDRGTFIEAGANDGYLLSNTYYFEKLRGWAGLLIEPVPELAAECRRNRRSEVVEAALVGPGAPETVELHFAGLMSTVSGALGDARSTASHVSTGLALQQLTETYRLQVPARTLSSLLDQVGWTREIDFLSLDVEGGEAAALRGIDWQRHAPRFICVEVRPGAEPAIEEAIGPRYRVEEILADAGTYRDVLYRRA